MVSTRPTRDPGQVIRLAPHLTTRNNRNASQGQVFTKQQYQRQDWPDLSIRLSHLPDDETTWNIWRNFEKEGTISWIEIFEDPSGKRSGNAKIRFSPPPREPFWTRHPVPNTPGSGYYPMDSEGDGGSRSYRVICLVDDKGPQPNKIHNSRTGKWYVPRMTLPVYSLHFGLMVEPKSFMSMYRTPRDPNGNDPILNGIAFTVDLRKHMLIATFGVEFRDPQEEHSDFSTSPGIGELDRVNQYKIEVPLDDLSSDALSRKDLPSDSFLLKLSLKSPPQFYRKRFEMQATHSPDNTKWNIDTDCWYRQTDIVYDPSSLKTTAITLHKDKPVIDIGRWTTYCFVVNQAGFQTNAYEEMRAALADFNIEIRNIQDLDLAPMRPAELWKLIDTAESFQASNNGLNQMVEGASTYLPWEVQYQLEACISQELINEYNITRPFLEKLAGLASKDVNKARDILEYVASQEERIFEPLRIFDDPAAMAFSPRTDIPHYCAYSRKVRITPTTMWLSSPAVEPTNRVLRNYERENREGRFLRVQFADELSKGPIYSSAGQAINDEMFTRVYRTLFNGIKIGDRHYELLAWGNSQFRENGAYFYCPTPHLSCNDIRQWMGNFSHIDVVAKYAARLGQCFSTTRAFNGVSKPKLIAIPDIEKPNLNSKDGSNFCFTDGVGKISVELAEMIVTELRLRVPSIPSGFQFRLGGCKGVLVVWPDVKGMEIHIRKSQEKFTSTYNGLEIIRASQCSKASLNRQTITILSALGVPDDVFVKMLVDSLDDYEKALSDENVAIQKLTHVIDENQMTLNIAAMIRNGFMEAKDPFVLSLLHLWRSWSILNLKEKAKITVKDSAFLMGVVDETGTLRGHTDSTAFDAPCSEDDLPQIFLQVPDDDDITQYSVRTGICLVGRNPSLHPGDLRVVQAVDVPALQHLRDVVVFPSTGDRDIPGMCSGGDLDGDDFFVIWDPNLRPHEWNCTPMNYDAPPKKKHKGPVRIEDLMKFFVRFMKNDSLKTIATAHLAQSDALVRGVKDQKCLKLAELHSKAVDYLKTGQPAEMPKSLRIRKRPHFMNTNTKGKARLRDNFYHSSKILGQLYDRVELVAFRPQYDHPFDKRILRAYALDNSLLKTIRQIKTQYDTALRRLMAQQEIATEFEVWSTFVLSKPRIGSDYKLQEQMGSLSDALKDQFRAICIAKAGGKDFSVLGPFVAGMYKVTNEEMAIALAECRSTKVVGGREVPKRRMEPKFMPLFSFPWLFEKELGRIATGVEGVDDLEAYNLTGLVHSEPARRRPAAGAKFANPADDFVQREDGVIIHRGEELILFDDDGDDAGDEEDDFEDLQTDFQDHGRYMTSENGEAFMEKEFRTKNPLPENVTSGTGVEEVVPQAELEGFLSQRQQPYRENMSDWRANEKAPQVLGPTSSKAAEVTRPANIITSPSQDVMQVATGSSSPALTPVVYTPVSDAEEEEETVVHNTGPSALDRLAMLLDE